MSHKILLVAGIALLSLASMIAFAGAVFQTTASYSAFGGMYVEEYKKLDVSVGGVWWFPLGSQRAERYIGLGCDSVQRS
ncbi:MAG: hypothetical protein DRJ67_12695 [Thermoprotei archaeon]|nr:MAG: hypothetical protein DRJ67_12695 [Thermoprotei archaeon]